MRPIVGNILQTFAREGGRGGGARIFNLRREVFKGTRGNKSGFEAVLELVTTLAFALTPDSFEMRSRPRVVY